MESQKLDNMYFVLILLVASLAVLAPYAISDTGAAANYRNVTVSTQVNITNSFPEVLSTRIDSTFTLNAGTTRELVCNATVRDFDGIGSVTVNGTLFDTSEVTLESPNDNNNHYTNSSCFRYGNTSTIGNYSCSFQVQYYANNGTDWNCTVQAIDDTNITGSGSNQTEIEALIALNITPDVFDYGNMEVGEISNITDANVTNFGNQNINVTVRGFGAVEGDNLSMVCTFNNIPVEEQRYSLNSTDIWTSMANLTSSDQFIANLSLSQRTNDSAGGEVFNGTYWRLRIPTASNPGGNCSGNIVFQAELG